MSDVAPPAAISAAIAVLTNAWHRCHAPYSPDVPWTTVLSPEARSRGAVRYGALAAGSGTPPGPFATIVVGQVPYRMKPERLRWVIHEVTGVMPRSVKAARVNLHGRRASGLFFINVRAGDVNRVLAKTRTALCCPDFLWVPRADMTAAAVVTVVQELKLGGFVANGLLTFDIPLSNHESSIVHAANESGCGGAQSP